MFKYIACLLLITSPCISFATEREQLLINHVQSSLELAIKEKSSLDIKNMSIEGMTSPKIRHLLNNLCSLPNAAYLEIGCWKGSTLTSALYDNEDSVVEAIAIDNWSLFGGPKNEFLANVQRFIPNSVVQVYEADSFSVPMSIFSLPINIYFYDGAHDPTSQELAFTYFNDVLDDVFIALVDDWNEEGVRMGTRAAFQKLNYTVLFERSLHSNCNGDPEGWWNGLYVAVIRKN